MAAPDADAYAAPVQRVERRTLLLTAAGAAASGLVYGPAAGAGFLLGGLAAYFNFKWIRKLVEALGSGDSKPKGGAAMAVLLGLRYAIIGISGYVIIKYFGVSLIATLAGLMTAVVAVLLEALFLLIRDART